MATCYRLRLQPLLKCPYRSTTCAQTFNMADHLLHTGTLRPEPLFVFLIEEEKRRLYLNGVKPLRSPSPNFWTSQSRFFASNWFFECEHLFINKSIVITEPAVASTRLLGLGSKLYPSNMQRILKKDLTQFTESLSRVRQNQASQRKALLAG